MKKIILASQSPRRKELLTQAGYEFQVITSDVEEKIMGEEPDEIAESLACQKAEDVFNKLVDEYGYEGVKDYLVIGADTIVSIAGEILGKPKSEADAFNMLSKLQGKTHQVYTGVSIVKMGDNEIEAHIFSECTQVTFYPMTEDEIWSYVNSKDCMDKAGSYGIQGNCAVHIKGIEGDYNNVVGMPIARLYQELKTIN